MPGEQGRYPDVLGLAPSMAGAAAGPSYPTIGTMCSLPSPVSAEILAKSGFDFVVLDAQHGGPNLGNLLELVQAVELGGSTPIVRVPWYDAPTIMRVLDLGARGVIVPMVNTADEASLVVAACRYPPDGYRSYGQHRGGFGDTKTANRENLCITMIETVEGLGNVDEIAATPGVDGIFIGPIDLSLSMGFGGYPGLSEPVFEDAIGAIGKACRQHGTMLGMPLLAHFQIEDALSLGCSFVTVGGDALYIRQGAAADLSALRVRTES